MELIPNKLYFYLDGVWKNSSHGSLSDTVVKLDNIYKHNQVRKHFGPPTLKVIWKHCDEIDSRIKKNSKLVFLTNDQNDNVNIEQRTITSFLMGAYAVLRLHWDPEKANEELLTNIPARLAFFRDYHGDSSYRLNILDCLRGLRTGCLVNHWFTSYSSTVFPRATNSRLDMNWVVPNMFIAFKDPTLNRTKEHRSVSKAMIKELKRCGIKIIVRLNSNDSVTNFEYYGMSYHVQDMKNEDFIHFDIPFRDVDIPTLVQAKQFVRLCERFKSKIAVHCHAGLGRTATMIGCHLIKNYQFDARSACAWLKMCRRGSVMGPQHFFLNKYENEIRNTESSNDSLKIVSIKKVEIPAEKTVIKLNRACSNTPVNNGVISHRACNESQNNTPETPGRITRPPRKNNIIHITPVRPQVPKTSTLMQKYKTEGYTTSEQVNKKSASISTPKSRLFIKSSSAFSTNNNMCNEENGVKITPTPNKRDAEIRNADKCNKREGVKSLMSSCRRYSSKDNSNLKAGGSILIREKKRICRTAIPRTYRPMNKKVTKSHDTMLSSKEKIRIEASRVQHINGDNKMTNGLVSHSKSKVYSLINNIYSQKSVDIKN